MHRFGTPSNCFPMEPFPNTSSPTERPPLSVKASCTSTWVLTQLGLRPDLACHYIVVNDWTIGVTAPQNVVLVSIPSLLDPSLAPPRQTRNPCLHPRQRTLRPLARNGTVAAQPIPNKSKPRAEVMWKALERIIPDIRTRCDVTLIGTPLTHERFLRRHRGTYGPAIRAGEAIFPGPKTPLPGLLCCGDSTFPGIGLPAVAASGMIAANTLAPVGKHLDMLRRVVG